MNMYRKTLTLVALLCVTGCNSLDPLIVPDVKTVTMIEGRIANSYNSTTGEHVGKVEIRDISSIKKIIEYFTHVNKDMESAFLAVPTPTHTIIVTGSNSDKLVIYLGANWIGGKNIISGVVYESRFRNISVDQRLQLLCLLSIDDYDFNHNKSFKIVCENHAHLDQANSMLGHLTRR